MFFSQVVKRTVLPFLPPTKKMGDCPRTGKRYHLVKAFFNEACPTKEKDLDVVFAGVNMKQHLDKIFKSVTSRVLQHRLLEDFDLLRLCYCETQQSTHQNQVSCSTNVVYVGLLEYLQQSVQDTQVAIDAVQRSLDYAELRLANPETNMLKTFLETLEEKKH